MRRALAFLTPLGGAAAPDRRTLAWFPVVGALLGAGVGVVWWSAGQVWPPLLAAALAVVADLALTGMLHYDGLIDTSDGLLPHLDRDRRMEVMAGPDAGAFGATVAAASLVVRVAALATMAPSVVLTAAVWCASRTLMAVAALALPYARPGGLASDFLGGRAAPVLVLGTVMALALGVAAGPVRGAAAVVAVAIGGGAVLALARRRLGGFTGDVLGAAGVVGETAGLVVAAARW